MHSSIWLVLLALLAGCAAVDARPEEEQARAFIRAATGADEVYDPERGVLGAAELEAVLADGLGLEEATRLALLNNRRLQAGFARLGVGKAELVQAGLLRNPSLSLAFLLPSGGGGAQLTLDLAQSVLELWQIPRREAVARAELAQDVLELSRFAGALVADVRRAYLQAAAAEARIDTARASQELAQREQAASEARLAGGVATESETALARTRVAQLELAALQAVLAAAGTKRELAALLSLDSDLAGVELVDALPEPADLPVEREELVARALTARLDLRAAAQACEGAQARLVLEQGQRVPALDVTLAAERPELGNDPSLLLGPGVALELPVFDTHSTAIRAAQHEFVARSKEYEALRAEAAQAVRAALDRQQAAVRVAQHVERELLPEAERGHELARRAQALGGVTALVALESQRGVLAARAQLLESRLEAALARVELERALGAPLTGP